MTRCSDGCKIKKMQLEGENNKMKRELNLIEETKQNLEKQNRMYEHEVSTGDFATKYSTPKCFNFSSESMKLNSEIVITVRTLIC